MSTRKRPIRSRPKRTILDAAAHAQARREWRRWMPSMRRDLSDLFVRSAVFWDLQEVAKRNPALLANGTVFDWACRSHMLAVSMGLRAFVDQDRRSHSLWVLLFQILERPGAISRRAHRALYRGVLPGFGLADLAFDRVVGQGVQVMPARIVRRDLQSLETASDRLRRFANKRIAHRTAPGTLRRPPRLDEIDRALTTLDTILCKYDLLLTGHGEESYRRKPPRGYLGIFENPWLAKGQAQEVESLAN